MKDDLIDTPEDLSRRTFIKGGLAAGGLLGAGLAFRAATDDAGAFRTSSRTRYPAAAGTASASACRRMFARAASSANGRARQTTASAESRATFVAYSVRIGAISRQATTPIATA